ncbi:MAG: SagB/ThcOx family dehydrogenase [Actinomycetota bacterium]
MRVLIPLFVVVLVLGAASCSAGPDPASETTRAATPLPAPEGEGTVTLEQALVERRSIREFTDRPLTDAQIGQLLWAAQGQTAEWGGRTAPSAGALYPLDVYVAVPDGVFHYRPDEHALARMGEGGAREALSEAAAGQETVAGAPAVFVITGEYARTEVRYGDRAVRYVHLEAGHAAQNLLLQATALSLGAVPIGAFDDEAVRETLRLPPGYAPLYLIPVGTPAAE